MAGSHPFHLDSKAPSLAFADFAARESRFALLPTAAPGDAGALIEQAQRDIDERWHLYEQEAELEREL